MYRGITEDDPRSSLMHYGVPGMRWGHRKNSYRSTGVRSAIARRQNEKVDKSFKDWNKNTKLRNDAIDLGKKANASRIAYQNDRKNKDAKLQYRSDKKAYKDTLRKNTTYRKGVVKQEVGRDAARKYLTEAKRVKKQLDLDPQNKKLQKQYNDLMSKHDVERARARRAVDVSSKRSQKKASIKRTLTMSAKVAATTATVSAGLYGVNKMLESSQVTLNGKQVSFSKQNVADLAKIVNIGKDLMGYF